MNKQLIRSRFAKASDSYTKAAFMQARIAEKMMQLLLSVNPQKGGQLLEVGCGTGFLSRLLVQHLQPDQLILNDICLEMKTAVSDLLYGTHTFLWGDAENLSFPNELTMIASCSAIQWFEDHFAFFEKCQHSLMNSGLLVMSTFGKENLRELKRLTGTTLDYPSLEVLKQDIVNAGFEIMHLEEDILTFSFDTPLAVLQHLKKTGVTGISHQVWTKGKLEKYKEAYIAQYGQGVGVPLTYHPIYIIAKKK